MKTNKINFIVLFLLAFALILTPTNFAFANSGDKLEAQKLLVIQGRTNTDVDTDPNSLFGESPTKYVVVELTESQKIAYKRAIDALLDYESRESPIKIDMSDLGMTPKQALQVGYMIHASGEVGYFANTGDDYNYMTDEFSISLNYNKDKIKEMQSKLNARVDEIIEQVGGYKDQLKQLDAIETILGKSEVYSKTVGRTAYTALVGNYGNCMAYTQAFNLICKRLGYETDECWSRHLNHIWSLVLTEYGWKHFDTRWDLSTNSRDYFGQSDSQFLAHHGGWWCANYALKMDYSQGAPQIIAPRKPIIKDNGLDDKIDVKKTDGKQTEFTNVDTTQLASYNRITNFNAETHPVYNSTQNELQNSQEYSDNNHTIPVDNYKPNKVRNADLSKQRVTEFIYKVINKNSTSRGFYGK